MPANEQTWRDIPLLHRVFGVSALLMLITHDLVIWNDQRREWRQVQTNVVKVDTRSMIRWREEQYKTDVATRELHDKADAKLKADAQFIDPDVLSESPTRCANSTPIWKRSADGARANYDMDGVTQRQQEQAEAAHAAEVAWYEAEAAQARRRCRPGASTSIWRSAARSPTIQPWSPPATRPRRLRTRPLKRSWRPIEHRKHPPGSASGSSMNSTMWSCTSAIGRMCSR